MIRSRILTGDTPTGPLHIGHYVGSVKRRVELQDTHECYILLANMHAFTTRAEQSSEIRRDTLEKLVKNLIELETLEGAELAALLA